MTKQTNSNSFAMRVGNQGGSMRQTLVEGFRTREQFERVREIVLGRNFNFACSGNNFIPGDRDYDGPFSFVWYDTNDKIHVTRIGKRGRVLREVTA